MLTAYLLMLIDILFQLQFRVSHLREWTKNMMGFSYANFTLIMRERSRMLSIWALSKSLTLLPTVIPWRYPWFGEVNYSQSRTRAAFSPGWITRAPPATPHRNCALEVCCLSLGINNDPAPQWISYSESPKRTYTHLTEAHWSSLSIILCRAFLPSSGSALLPSLVHPANWLEVHPIPLDQISDKDIKQNSPSTEPWWIPLMTSCQLDFLHSPQLFWPGHPVNFLCRKLIFFPEFQGKISI